MTELHTYHVKWSEEDAEYVATCPDYPSLSWLAPTKGRALAGLGLLIDNIDSDNEPYPEGKES